MDKKLHVSLLGILVLALGWSVIKPNSMLVWALEIGPVILLMIVLIWTYNRFKFSNLVYILIAITMILMIIGGHYDYAKVPLFDFIKNYFSLSRNHYDRVGHFFEGVSTSIAIKEVFEKKKIILNRKWTNFIVVAVCLAISASYEIIEFLVCLINSNQSIKEGFLGMQGDIWDAQWDMVSALSGTIISVIAFRNHKIEVNK